MSLPVSSIDDGSLPVSSNDDGSLLMSLVVSSNDDGSLESNDESVESNELSDDESSSTGTGCRPRRPSKKLAERTVCCASAWLTLAVAADALPVKASAARAVAGRKPAMRMRRERRGGGGGLGGGPLAGCWSAPSSPLGPRAPPTTPGGPPPP